MTCYRHATWEGIPTIYTEPPEMEAFCWDGDKWIAVDWSEVNHKATAISENLFREMFGDLKLPPPPPPARALVLPDNFEVVTEEAETIVIVGAEHLRS